MRLSTDSYKKLGKWIDEINEKTGSPGNFPSKIEFAKAYIKNSFDFVVKNFSYDFGLKQYLSQFTGELHSEKYNENTTLEKLIQDRVGVCKQFSSLLCILTANDKSTLQNSKVSVAPSMLVCQIHLKNGEFDWHMLNSYNFKNDLRFCDPTMQMVNKNRNFFLQSKQNLQNELQSIAGNKIFGFADNVEIKARNLERVCDIVSEGCFKTNKTTKDYKSTTLIF